MPLVGSLQRLKDGAPAWIPPELFRPEVLLSLSVVVPIIVGLAWWLSRPLRRSVGRGVGVLGSLVSRGVVDFIGNGTPDQAWSARFEDLERRNQELRGFFVNFPEQVQRLNSTLDLDQVSNIVVQATGEMLQAGSVQLFLIEPDGDELTLFRHLEGGVAATKLLGSRFPVDQAPQAWIMTQKTASTALDWPFQHRGKAGVEIVGGGAKFPVEIAAPVRLGEERMGLITASRLESLTGHHQQVLACWSNVAAFSLQNAKRMVVTQQLADTDRMTGLYNHACFHQHLLRHVRISCRTEEPLSVAMLDVDHFKTYNDTHGHAAGDRVLQHLASILAEVAPGGSVLARYGGEEFVLLLPGLDESEAAEQAEIARIAVANRRFEGGDQQPLGYISMSAGVAARGSGDESGTEMMAIADSALYQSKADGRDRVSQGSSIEKRERRRRDRRSRRVPVGVEAETGDLVASRTGSGPTDDQREAEPISATITIAT